MYGDCHGHQCIVVFKNPQLYQIDDANAVENSNSHSSRSNKTTNISNNK